MAVSVNGASASTLTPVSTTHSSSITYGGSTTNIDEGPIYLQVDMSKIGQVEDLIAIVQEARQRRRAQRVA